MLLKMESDLKKRSSLRSEIINLIVEANPRRDIPVGMDLRYVRVIVSQYGRANNVRYHVRGGANPEIINADGYLKKNEFISVIREISDLIDRYEGVPHEIIDRLDSCYSQFREQAYRHGRGHVVDFDADDVFGDLL